MRPPIIPAERREWSMSDGYLVRGRVWLPTQPDRQHAVLYLHGIQSHGEWFEGSASLLADAGGSVVILPDRRGSGLNQEARGDTPSWKRWLEDLDEIAAWAAREYDIRHFDLVGVSWGGKLATAWARLHSDIVRRILLIAPGLFPAVDVGWRERFQIGRCLLTNPGRRFPIPLNDPALFTNNPLGREFIAKDALKLTDATARFFWHSRLLDRQLLHIKAGSFQTHLTLILAEHDRIIHNTLTSMWVTRISGGGAEIESDTGSAHTLEFEADSAVFDAMLRDWVTTIR